MKKFLVPLAGAAMLGVFGIAGAGQPVALTAASMDNITAGWSGKDCDPNQGRNNNSGSRTNNRTTQVNVSPQLNVNGLNNVNGLTILGSSYQSSGSFQGNAAGNSAHSRG